MPHFLFIALFTCAEKIYNHLTLEDCYKLLGVPPDATAAEIRRAYRIKAKQFHPDSTGSAATAEKFHRLARAYEILSDAKQRSLFDESFFYRHKVKAYRSTESFDYRAWLSARTDFESRAKLIFFDLLHLREDEAVAEFVSMSRNHADFRLSDWFTREDFMDFGFILCEELVLREEYYDAFSLLEQIIKMEYSFSYFRLFFPEVMELARSVLKYKIEKTCSPELCLDAWERALELGFGNRDDAFFLQKMADVYRRMGDVKTASICEEEACRL